MSDQLREAAERKKLQLFAKRYLEDIEVGVQPPDGMVFVLATYAAEQLTGDGGNLDRLLNAGDALCRFVETSYDYEMSRGNLGSSEIDDWQSAKLAITTTTTT